MSDPAVSMAILTVNQDRLGKDVLARFEPIVLDRLYHSEGQHLVLSALQSQIRDEYGITIPASALHTISKRLSKQGLLTRNHSALSVDRDALVAFDLTTSRRNVERQYEALDRSGRAFASGTMGVEMAEGDFGAALWDFIRRNSAPLLKTVVDGRPLVAAAGANQESLEYVVAPFIVDAYATNPQVVDQLDSIIKGAVIASALYFPDPTDGSRRLDHVDFFLDTAILLRAVGACGPELQSVATDLLTLGSDRGARFKAYEHNLKEVRGVLAAAQAAVQRPSRGYYGEAVEYMVTEGWGYSDVVMLEDSLEDRLATLGVAVVATPPHQRDMTIDEIGLEDLLQEKIGYSNEATRLNDVDSLAATFRLRGGKSVQNLAGAKAVFVTPNVTLAGTARVFFKAEGRGAIPICFLDHELTTLLWVTQELHAPNLPLRSLVADSISAMRVDDHVWRLYVEKLDVMRDRKAVTANDYVLARQSLQVRSLIMLETDSNPELFTEGSLKQIIARVHASISAEEQRKTEAAQHEAESERQARIEQEAGLLAQVAEKDRLFRVERAKTDAAADRIARTATLALFTIATILAAVGTFVVQPWASGWKPGGIAGAVVGGLIVLVGLLSLAAAVFGWSLALAYPWVHGLIRKRVLRWLDMHAMAGASSQSG